MHRASGQPNAVVPDEHEARAPVSAAVSVEPREIDERLVVEALREAAGDTTATPEEDEARIEALTNMLHGDPTNDAVVDELTVRLTRLGRSMDLLALLSARLEDAPPERRNELLPRHRAVLERLEQEARAAGRDGEADLFRMARDAS
jgi:hypothetical protein